MGKRAVPFGRLEMNQIRSKCLVALMVGFLSLAALPAHGGVFRDTIRGLEFAGFQFAGQENPLSGGAQFSLTRNFTGQTLDFGATEMTLTGPIEFTFETGGRNLPVLDFSLNTNNQPFSYVLTSSSGAQDTEVRGNFLLDATGSMNTFGFYDMTFQLSSRADSTQEGRYQDGVEEQLDFDLGPIDISGNVFADALAMLFDPFFEATGTPNFFASFSGRAQLDQQFDQLVAEALAKTDAGQELTDNEVGRLIGMAELNAMVNGQSADLSFLDGVLGGGGSISQEGLYQVPEPATLTLLLAPAVIIIARRRR